MALLSRTPSIAVFYRTSGWLRFCPKDAHRFTTDALSRRASTIHATPLVSETSQKLILQEINVSDSFQKSRLRKEVASALQEAGITSLTEIQVLSLFRSLCKSLFQDQSHSCHSEFERRSHRFAYRLWKNVCLSHSHCKPPIKQTNSNSLSG